MLEIICEIYIIRTLSSKIRLPIQSGTSGDQCPFSSQTDTRLVSWRLSANVRLTSHVTLMWRHTWRWLLCASESSTCLSVDSPDVYTSPLHRNIISPYTHHGHRGVHIRLEICHIMIDLNNFCIVMTGNKCENEQKTLTCLLFSQHLPSYVIKASLNAEDVYELSKYWFSYFARCVCIAYI